MRYAGRQILIVDDEVEIAELLKESLQKHGYVCHTAPGGAQALEKLAGESIDLVLIDIMMPTMTGLTLFRHIKELYPDLAVIFVTAVDDLNLAVEHLKTGAYDYIVKPVTRSRLWQAVEETLEKRDAALEEAQHRDGLEEQRVRQARDLEAKTREISALNRMFYGTLSDR